MGSITLLCNLSLLVFLLKVFFPSRLISPSSLLIYILTNSPFYLAEVVFGGGSMEKLSSDSLQEVCPYQEFSKKTLIPPKTLLFFCPKLF